MIELLRKPLAVYSLLLLTLLGQALPAQANVEMVDKIIAIVDDDVILASELQERYAMVMKNIDEQTREAIPPEKIRSDIFDQLILESIQLQIAYRVGLRISDAQLDESMARIAGQNGLNLQQFRQALEGDGISYAQTREKIRRDMLLQRVQQGSVNQRVQISDQEIDNFLASAEGQQLTAPEYRIYHALLEVPSTAPQDQIVRARQLVEQRYQQLQQGADFQQLVNEPSNPPFRFTDIGWRKAADLPSLFSSVATEMSAGDVHPPIENASGFHLIKLADKRGEGELVAQTRARHILLKASAIRDEQATEETIKTLRQRILDGEDFAALAREYSEDIGSAAEGGDLGWTSPGQLVEAFQQAMDNTDIDDISPAFRSQYGWHILQVTERRKKDVTDDLRRNIARNYIHQRKYDDELQAWLQKIRDEAYVDIK